MKVLLVAVFALVVVACATATGVASDASKKSKCLVCEAMVQSVYDSASDAELIEASGIVPQLSRFGLSPNMIREAMKQITSPIRAAKEAGAAPQDACLYAQHCEAQANTMETASHNAMSDITTQHTRLDFLNGKLCGLCELTIAIIQNYLAAQQSQAAIEKSLLKFCAELPAPTSTVCSVTVTMMLPKIIKSLEKPTMPNVICYDIQLCPLN